MYTVPSGALDTISDGATGIIGMLWEVAPVLLPITLVVVAIGFIPRLIKRLGK